MFKFDNIALTLPDNSVLRLYLTNVASFPSPFILKKITGLESAPSELSLVDFLGSRKYRSREIVITFALDPTFADDNNQYRQLRDLVQSLYGGQYVMTKLALRLGGSTVGSIRVALKDLDADLSSPDPEYVLTLETGELQPNIIGVGTAPYNAIDVGPNGASQFTATNPGHTSVGFKFTGKLTAVPAQFYLSLVASNAFDFPVGLRFGGAVSITYYPALAVNDVITYDSVNMLITVKKAVGGAVITLLPYVDPSADRVFYRLPPRVLMNITTTLKMTNLTFEYTPEYVGV